MEWSAAMQALALYHPLRRFRLGDCFIDESRHRIERNGLSLTVREPLFDVLVFLMHNAGRTVSSYEIWHVVCGKTGKNADAGVAQMIAILRRLLNDDGHHTRCIEVVTGRGYRCVFTPVPVP